MRTKGNLVDNSTTAVPWESVTLNNTERTFKDAFYNGSGFYVDDDSDGFTDLQTLILACFATLLPLIVVLVAAFVLRILWRRYKNKRKNDSYNGILSKEDTSESISRPLHAHLFTIDKQCETMEINKREEVKDVCNNPSQTRSNHSNTNGSIITMTLKNNHLIVETEERNDIEEDCRETTMRYSPSARDGIFVVEVQQGIRRSPGSGTKSISDQCAVVHDPPDRYVKETKLIRTGLSQSCNSLESYCYTNQQAYNNGPFGYPIYSLNEPLRTIVPSNDDKPKITAAIYKAQFCQFEDPEQEIILDSTTEHILIDGKDCNQ